MGRGLSAEEKRTKLLEIFRESKDIFQLKELEKCAPKMKGIVAQSVKEVLQSLVDDGFVQADKIGSANFFWSFPSQSGAVLSGKLEQAKEQLTALNAEVTSAREAIERERAARIDSAERTTHLGTLASLKTRVAEMGHELDAYALADPAKVEEKRATMEAARECATRNTGTCRMIAAGLTHTQTTL
ncbi:meiotic nuclear division protein 1 [Exidia glandulosa HHB12029]|uniref:Meiotic nuclear division protein 1 n=1 Tax=Exidia glandulosa HHB12029 TaxID=1314781 RepID=A0A165E109_EXIGL|nr:meiotic nuclear division protein 1 [Exidia glandulosa HHB12029]